ncbi:hypothetical protein [Clostridium sp. Marseille-QA1073]
MYKDFFISQNEQEFYPEVSCGIASLSMLLKYHGILEWQDFKILGEKLNFKLSPGEKGYDEDDSPYGVYPEDIFKFCVENKIKFRMSFYDDEWKECLKIAPIMVLLTGNEEEFGLRNSHWVVLVERNKDYFTYYDPWYKKENDEYIRHIWYKDFHEYYTGIACQIL